MAAFHAFTARLGDWWVPEFTWSGPALLDRVGLEPRPGGFAYEIGPHGMRIDWGRVLDWQPPQRLVLAWHIPPDRVPRPDPASASEVEVHFHPRSSGTTVDLEHRYFERHGPAGAEYRAVMAVGWQELLDRFAVACRGASGRQLADNTKEPRIIRRPDSDHAHGGRP